SSCSTRPPAPWTRPRTCACSRPSTGSPAAAPRSPSPTGSPPPSGPTGSWCWTTATWSSTARTTSWSTSTAASTPACTAPGSPTAAGGESRGAPTRADTPYDHPVPSSPPGPDPRHPPIPPISARDEPRFRDRARKQALAAAFEGQGEDYDRLRPGYPDAALDAMLAHVPVRSGGGPPRAVDLGRSEGR